MKREGMPERGKERGRGTERERYVWEREGGGVFWRGGKKGKKWGVW